MSNKKYFALLSSIGFALGIVLCTSITVITSSALNDGVISFCSHGFEEAVGNHTLALVLQTIISGMYGAVVMGTTVFYNFDSWSILKSTVLHCVITLSSYYVTGFILHWFSPKDITENLIMIVIFFAVYFLIWLVNYLSYKTKVKRINEDLKNLDDKD